MRHVIGFRLAIPMASLLALGPAPGAVQAQSTSETGKLKTKVIDALKAVAGGKCPEDLMGALLLDQCEQGLDRMKEHLSGLGPLKEAKYKGIDQAPNGAQLEVYRVVFENGSMSWMAAGSPGGKLSFLWSPGDVSR